MTTAKTDRRYVRTEERILRAMTDLLRVRKFDKITVTDICKMAGVSHSSFYAHFTSKADLVNRFESNLLHENLGVMNGRERVPLHEILLGRLTYLNGRGEFLAMLLSKNGSPEIKRQLERDFTNNLKHVILPHMNVTIHTEVGERYLSVFLASAMLGVIQEWIDSGRKETPERLAKLLDGILGAGLGGKENLAPTAPAATGAPSASVASATSVTLAASTTPTSAALPTISTAALTESSEG